MAVAIVEVAKAIVTTTIKYFEEEEVLLRKEEEDEQLLLLQYQKPTLVKVELVNGVEEEEEVVEK